MNTFSLVILDATHSETIDNVSSFVGEDSSGSFGILAGHARMITTLVMGLARYRIADQPWQYLAQPGAVLYFSDNLLTISTRHYLRDENYMRISNDLAQKLLVEEEQLHTVKQNLQKMEEEILKHMWELRREGVQ
ncbi:MAG: F0F1 ATP synthase subunit epsilon [Gammaproteobacteria bacterium]|nr:F0F1 ATP synthase subunit epsilon [Gammaproteobacteria bacterium]